MSNGRRSDEFAPVCKCGHERGFHGNADGQTGWQARCGHPVCDCEDYDAPDDRCLCGEPLASDGTCSLAGFDPENCPNRDWP